LKSDPEIIAAPEPPFAIDTLVVEEDTYLVLSAGNYAAEPKQQTDSLISQAAYQDAVALGEVIVKGKRWLAVVYDFDQDPALLDSSVDAALDNIFRLVEDRRFTAIGLQALGCFHGNNDVGTFLERLSVRQHAGGLPDCLQKLWVVTKS
jgi:hypothetical protein